MKTVSIIIFKNYHNVCKILLARPSLRLCFPRKIGDQVLIIRIYKDKGRLEKHIGNKYLYRLK
jgi:hypothetical protein